MSDDLDRLLRDSLKSAGDEYDRLHSPQRKAEARQRFLERYEKRRWVFPFTSAVVGLGLAALVGLGVYAIVDSPPDAVPRERTSVAGQDEAVVRFPFDGEPVDMGVRDNGGWVADARDGELVKIDPVTGEAISSVALSDSPKALALGTGSVWVGDPEAGQLFQVDKDTEELVGEPIDIGDPSETMSLSIGTEAVWVVSSGELRMIDLETSEVTVVETAPQPIDVAANLGTVWVFDGELGLMMLDASTGESLSDPIPIRGRTADVYAGAEGIWVADRGDDTIVSVDPENGQLLVTAQVQGSYLDLGFDSSAMWVLSRASGSTGYLTPIGLETGEPLADPLLLDGDPVDVATGAGAVWVALRGEQAIARIDPGELFTSESTTATP